jgi:hypothetical protein
LLVFGNDSTRDTLRSLGVDTSNWESGIGELLGYTDEAVGEEQDGTDTYSNKPMDASLHQSSSSGSYRRSHSPPPHRDHSPHTNRRRSPVPRYQPNPSYAAVYVIDVQDMYACLMQEHDPSISLEAVVRSLLGTNVTGWCAGNECQYVIYILVPHIEIKTSLACSLMLGGLWSRVCLSMIREL